MANDRNEVIAALRQGALNSDSQYVSVRREDLLVALGEDPPRPATQPVPEPAKDKKQA
jgi:hypothetical protein